MRSVHKVLFELRQGHVHWPLGYTVLACDKPLLVIVVTRSLSTPIRKKRLPLYMLS